MTTDNRRSGTVLSTVTKLSTHYSAAKQFHSKLGPVEALAGSESLSRGVDSWGFDRSWCLPFSGAAAERGALPFWRSRLTTRGSDADPNSSDGPSAHRRPWLGSPGSWDSRTERTPQRSHRPTPADKRRTCMLRGDLFSSTQTPQTRQVGVDVPNPPPSTETNAPNPPKR